MVAQARTQPDDSGAIVRWREASALDLPDAGDTFDTVICQQGLQFFPDPAAGIREMARVSRDGGRIGVTVWSAADRSPFLHHETQMLARHGSGPQAEYSATADQMGGWFADGGVPDVSIELITVEIDLPPVLTDAPEHLRAVPWSERFFALPADDQLAALHELDELLSEYRTDDGIRVPFNSYLATAHISR